MAGPIWQQALATAALVPASKAKRFKNTLAELANADARSLPLERHDFLPVTEEDLSLVRRYA